MRDNLAAPAPVTRRRPCGRARGASMGSGTHRTGAVRDHHRPSTVACRMWPRRARGETPAFALRQPSRPRERGPQISAVAAHDRPGLVGTRRDRRPSPTGGPPRRGEPVTSRMCFTGAGRRGGARTDGDRHRRRGQDTAGRPDAVVRVDAVPQGAPAPDGGPPPQVGRRYDRITARGRSFRSCDRPCSRGERRPPHAAGGWTRPGRAAVPLPRPPSAAGGRPA